LRQAEARFASSRTTSNFASLMTAQQNVAKIAAQEAMVTATAAIAVIGAEIALVKEGIEEYGNLARQIRMVSGLTGASTRQAEQFVNLSAVAGVNPAQSARELMQMARTTNTPKGAAAMARLGVTPGANELDTFYKIIGSLSKMQDGVQKTRLEMDLFGARGVAALQPFLALQGDIIEASNELTAHLDGKTMAAIAHLQQNVGLLGETFTNNFVIPIAQKIVPALDWLITKIRWLINEFHKLDEALEGIPSLLTVFVGIGVAVGVIVIGLIAWGTAIKAIIALQIIQAGWSAIIAALSGPAGWAALAVAGVVAAGVGISYYASKSGGDGKDAGKDIKDGADKFSGAVNAFGDAVNAHVNNWSKIAGGQLGSGFTEADYAFLAMQNAQGAIG
jgi:hypothetical protein